MMSICRAGVCRHSRTAMSESNPTIAYYVSAHGYGHGVRSCDIIRALNETHPAVTVHMVTLLPASFLSNRTGPGRNRIRARSFDVGMVQLDSIRVDVDATLAEAVQLLSH